MLCVKKFSRRGIVTVTDLGQSEPAPVTPPVGDVCA